MFYLLNEHWKLFCKEKKNDYEENKIGNIEAIMEKKKVVHT
jgi:hypothetical protein